MMSKKERILQRVALYLHEKTRISPDDLSMVRIFLTPWITLSIIETLKNGKVSFVIMTLVLYFFVVSTDFLDGPLARALNARSSGSHDMGYGGALDRISDKLLIVFSLVPFGANPFSVAIIIGESLLAFQTLHATTTAKKQATYVGKIKMVLQTFLMPILLLDFFVETSLISNTTAVYMALTVLFTFLSVRSHYRK